MNACEQVKDKKNRDSYSFFCVNELAERVNTGVVVEIIIMSGHKNGIWLTHG